MEFSQRFSPAGAAPPELRAGEAATEILAAAEATGASMIVLEWSRNLAHPPGVAQLRQGPAPALFPQAAKRHDPAVTPGDLGDLGDAGGHGVGTLAGRVPELYTAALGTLKSRGA